MGALVLEIEEAPEFEVVAFSCIVDVGFLAREGLRKSAKTGIVAGKAF